jgi:hypothetical protein
LSGAPESEEVLIEFERQASRARVLLVLWPDGRRSISFAFMGFRAVEPHWQYVAFSPSEARAVVEALTPVLDDLEQP